jgi:alpha-beta hydrolase superfamily lysophospholipase
MPIAHRVKRWSRVFLAGLPALVVADALLGLAYHTNTNAQFTIIAPRSGMTRRAVVIFPGYIMAGDTLSKAFAPYLADDDAMIGVTYAERGVDVPQISDAVMTTLRKLRPKELRIYGASMGGMVAKLFLDRYRAAGMPYGKVVLVLDSAPAHARHVKRSSILFQLSCWYRGGPISSVVLAAVTGLGPKPPMEPDARQDLVAAARHAGEWVGMPAATSQACFIARFPPLKERDLVNVARAVMYIQGVESQRDPLIRVPQAIAAWTTAFPNLRVVTLAARDGRWHLPLVEYPRATATALARQAP